MIKLRIRGASVYAILADLGAGRIIPCDFNAACDDGGLDVIRCLMPAHKACDITGIFFFLDPPYWKASYYKHNSKISGFPEPAETLAVVKSDFVLSINDHPEMSKMIAGYTIKPAPVFVSKKAAG